MKTNLTLFLFSIFWLVAPVLGGTAPKTITADSATSVLLWPTNIFSVNSNYVWAAIGGDSSGVLAVERGGTATTNAAGVRVLIGLDVDDPGAMGTNWLTLSTAAEGRGVLGLDVATPGELGTNLLTQATAGGVRGLVGLDAGAPGALGTNWLTLGTSADGQYVLGLYDWVTNSSKPLDVNSKPGMGINGAHSSAVLFDVDVIGGDAGVRFLYGANDYSLKMFGRDLQLVETSDGSTPHYTNAPIASAILNFMSLTNLFVRKTNEVALFPIADTPSWADARIKAAIYGKASPRGEITLHGLTTNEVTGEVFEGEVPLVDTTGKLNITNLVLGTTNVVSEIANKQATNVVADLTALGVYSGGEDTVFVQDKNTGGQFVRSSGLAVDGGIVVTNTATDDIFVRQSIGRIDVRWFGAVPDDLVDDSTAIQAAVDYSTRNVVAPDYYTEAGGAAMDVYIPQGIYKLATGLTAKHGLRLVGDGSSTILRYSGTGNAITIDNQVRGRSPIVIRDIQLKKVTTSTTGAAIAFVETHTPSTNWNYQVDLQNVIVSGEFSVPPLGSFFGFGIDYSPGLEARIQGGSMRNVVISNCNTNGVRLASVATGLTLDNVYVEGCAGHGFYVTGYPSYTTFLNCLSDNNGGDGYNVTNSSASISFISCGAENASTNTLTSVISTGVPFRLANGTFTVANPFVYTTTNRSAIAAHNVKSLTIIDPWLYSKPAVAPVPDAANYGLEIVQRANNTGIKLTGGYFYGFDTNCNVVLPDFVSTAGMEAAGLGSDLITITPTDWTLGAGWTTNGMDWLAFHHATGGGTATLTFDVGEDITANTYLLTWKVVGTASGQTYAAIATLGDSWAANPYYGYIAGTYTECLYSTTDGNLVFTPVNTFGGYITNITLKRVTTARAPTLVVDNSQSTYPVEIRSDNRANIWIGENAGEKDVTSTNSVAIGHNALSKSVSGYWNTVVGGNSLKEMLHGSRNVAVGFSTMKNAKWSMRNTAVGDMALEALKNGQQLTFFGKDAGLGYVSGTNDVAIGYYAMGYGWENSAENVAIGYFAGRGGTAPSGLYNVFLGANAGRDVTSADYSTAVGWGAGAYMSSGDYNTLIGARAGRGVTTGTQNTMLGWLAGFDLSDTDRQSTVDTYCTFLGVSATRSDVRDPATALSKSIAIGYQAQVGANNTCAIGGTGANAVSVVVGATNAAPSAVLDLTSTTKGALLPRVTSAERGAISAPAEGLLVFDTDENTVYEYSGSAWDSSVSRSGDVMSGSLIVSNAIGSTFTVSATNWVDSMVPAMSFRNGASAPTLGNGPTADVQVLLFAKAADNLVHGSVQLNHDYKEGTDILPHVHVWFPAYAASTAETNVWALSYSWGNISTNGFPSPTTITVTNSGVVQPNEHRVIPFSAISGAGKTISSILMVTVKRVGTDGYDVYDDNIGMLGFDVHYQSDTIGSSSEWAK